MALIPVIGLSIFPSNSLFIASNFSFEAIVILSSANASILIVFIGSSIVGFPSSVSSDEDDDTVKSFISFLL